MQKHESMLCGVPQILVSWRSKQGEDYVLLQPHDRGQHLPPTHLALEKTVEEPRGTPGIFLFPTWSLTDAAPLIIRGVSPLLQLLAVAWAAAAMALSCPRCSPHLRKQTWSPLPRKTQ